MGCCRFCIRGKKQLWYFWQESVKNHSTLNPVWTASVRFSGVYLSLTVTLLQEQKQKHYLNQGSGSFTLHGLESKPGSEGTIKGNLEFAPDKHVKKAPEQSHQNLIGQCFDLQIICTRLDVSAEPHWYICRYRATTPRCETFLSARIPPHHRTSRSNLAFSVQLSACTLLFKEDGLFWSDSSFTPLFFLFGFLSCLPFVSLSFYL